MHRKLAKSVTMSGRISACRVCGIENSENKNLLAEDHLDLLARLHSTFSVVVSIEERKFLLILCCVVWCGVCSEYKRWSRGRWCDLMMMAMMIMMTVVAEYRVLSH